MILNLISQKNFITFNKVIAKTIGLEEALVLGQVCSLSNIFKDNEFYFTYAEIQEETCLSEYAVKKAVQHLIKLGVVSVTKKGCPCKCWYTINENVIVEILESRNHSNCENEGSRPLENEGSRGVEIGGSFKKEIKKDIKTKDINSSAQPKNDTAPKQKSEYTQIIERYFDNFKQLYDNGQVMTEKPVVNFKQAGAMVKGLLKSISKESIFKVLDTAMNDMWIVSQGYPLAIILSATQVNKLLNAKPMQHYQQDTRVKKEVYTDEEYLAGMSDLDTIGF